MKEAHSKALQILFYGMSKETIPVAKIFTLARRVAKPYPSSSPVPLNTFLPRPQNDLSFNFRKYRNNHQNYFLASLVVFLLVLLEKVVSLVDEVVYLEMVVSLVVYDQEIRVCLAIL